MESIGSTILFLTFLVHYGAFVAGVTLVGALGATTLYELVRNKVSEGRVASAKSAQQPAEGGAA
jgi:hypothetical protein